MEHVNHIRSIPALVEKTLSETESFVATIGGREDQPAMVGYAEYGVPWHWAACQSSEGLGDVAVYRAFVDDVDCAAWMDNTTIVTANVLMSTAGIELMTPLTVWDLATFIRAVVCYEHIYHHEHPLVDDVRINELLGADVLRSVPLPIRESAEGRILPDPWDGAHRLICEVWEASHSWLRRLQESVGRDTLDGVQINLITEAWRAALGRTDLEPNELVDAGEVDRRWRSPSNQLLVDIANITTVDDTRLYLDPDENFQQLYRQYETLGLTDPSRRATSQVLSDLNMRTHINQQIAEFFRLPYACSAARLPFRRHLYDRALRIQQELTVARIVDDRYAEIAQTAQLRLPIFLAVALQDSDTPEDIWTCVAWLRSEAAAFREHREQMDRALIRGDLSEAKKISKALHTSVESLLEIAGRATTSATGIVLDHLSKGDLPTVTTAIGAAAAATKGALESSFAERLAWRLFRPQLLWINNLVEQSNHLTEALPDFARVWRIPPNRQDAFAQRFRKMALLAKD